MEQLDISIQYSARYFRSSAITPKTKGVWFVLHGYGQLAEYFIRKFKILEERDIVVIAPEGLSRFYLESPSTTQRKNNRVGATWMTREHRNADIHNYITFLNAVFDREITVRNIPITVLGFSQGSATASRWVMDHHIRFERLILWAGIFPADMNFNDAAERLSGKEVIVVCGTEDPFLSDERYLEIEKMTGILNTPVKKITFTGGHEINEEVLVSLTKPHA